jgi:hypothetical protein
MASNSFATKERGTNEMKSASSFEKFAARCWNLLNEGKPFTPIFVIGTMLLFYMVDLTSVTVWSSFILSFFVTVPLFIVFFKYDYPLFLRNYLWIPLIVYVIVWDISSISLLVLALCLYYFFTVFFWGTLYYHLRIGTTWLNFTRFWKLVLKNSDSTSGNAQEQMPKFMLLLVIWQGAFIQLTNGVAIIEIVSPLCVFYLFVAIFSWVLHRYLFDWKPDIIDSYTREKETIPRAPITNKVVVIVIDGMRKERFQEAKTPFLDKLRKGGTEYKKMETVYPARTVVCFTSMFTGTYPFEHGITSNMVYKLGIKVESIFDSLRKVGKKGRLLGIAHLVDSLGSDVDTVTAVMHNDVADRNITDRAKQIMSDVDPDLFIYQLIGTDQTGHSRGVFYDEYIQKIEEADQLVEEYVNWLKQEGKADDTTFIICADHGQADGIGGHGHLDEGERYVPFFMVGPSIKEGEIVEDKHSLVSMAPTIAHLLGAPFPSHSRGPVLTEAFKRKGEQDKS